MNVRVVLAVLLTVVVFVAALFVIQNSGRAVHLSLDLGFRAWKLEEPLPVTLLIGGAFLAGLVLGAGALWGRAARATAKAKRLEQQVALSGETREWR